MMDSGGPVGMLLEVQSPNVKCQTAPLDCSLMLPTDGLRLALRLVGKDYFPLDGDGGEGVVNICSITPAGGEWNVWGVVERYAGILQGFFSMEVLPILLGELCIEQIHIAPTKVCGSNLFIISINH